MAARHRVAIPGSERTAVPGARVVGAPDPQQQINVTLVLRRRPGSTGPTRPEHVEARRPGERRYLDRKEFAEAHGASLEDIAKVQAFAHDHHLTVVEVSPARRVVRLSGSVANLSAAFGVYLANYEHADGKYRSRTGPIYVPENLDGIVTAVLGLTNRPVAKPHFRRHHDAQPRAGARPLAASPNSHTPVQVAQIYDFPTGVDGTGQCIGIVELNTPADPNQPSVNVGAGYNTTDLNTFFSQLGLPSPSVTAISVDGGQNLPGLNHNADIETALDIEVAGAVAPGSQIAVYFAPNTDQGFLDAVTTAIHDSVNQPSVISISWGGPEGGPAQGTQAFDQSLQDAAALGVTVCCASGDNGSEDGVSDGLAHVDFPASSPFALACGGTRLDATGTTISSEVVWNEGTNGGAGGGGVSEVFDLPSWQANANVPLSINPGNHQGRGVPDIAGDADPATGYQLFALGQPLVIGGTSAVAPLIAGLVALMNESLGKAVGYLNPLLYGPVAATAGTVHDITQGNNDIDGSLGGAYQATVGWDPCTGLGSPDGAAVLAALTATAAGAQ
jgi:kumamolisin